MPRREQPGRQVEIEVTSTGDFQSAAHLASLQRDFAAKFDVMPFESQSVVEWHFDLEPRHDDLDALVDRARALRSETNPESSLPIVTLGSDGEVVDQGEEDGSKPDPQPQSDQSGQ